MAFETVDRTGPTKDCRHRHTPAEIGLKRSRVRILEDSTGIFAHWDLGLGSLTPENI
jgi:hypothetical protein